MAEPNDTTPQPAAVSVPLLTVPQVGEIRRQLESVFSELDLVHDVIVVCGVAAHSNVNRTIHGDVDLSTAVPHVIRRCATNRLHAAMKSLTEVVERFGGSTKLSDDKEGAA